MTRVTSTEIVCVETNFMAGNQTTSLKFGILLLAAGASRRMGGEDKLLKQIGGIAILRHLARECLASRAREIAVVLRPNDRARRALLDGLCVSQVTSADWQEGMAASLRAGMAQLVHTGLDGVVVMLADMPDIRAADIDRLIGAFKTAKNPKTICRATDSNGHPGHPVLFGSAHFDALARLRGDQGGRAILSDHADNVIDIPLAHERAVTDLDSPEDWARYLAKTPSPD